MIKKIINVTNGELNILPQFSITNLTTINDLKNNFAKLLIQDEYCRVNEGYLNFYLEQIVINGATFDFKFYFKNSALYAIDIDPKAAYVELYNKSKSDDWDDFDFVEEAEYRTKWLGNEVGDNTKFEWGEMETGFGIKSPCYEFKYMWGKIGVYIGSDQSGPFCNCTLNYKK